MKNNIGKITLKEVVELRLEYFKKLTQNIEDDLYEYNCGKLDSYNKIYIDISVMDEKDFLNKYCKEVVNFSSKMNTEKQEYIQKIGFESGKNNAIVEFLAIINPELEYFENVNEF
ncbi:hypothetical protein M2475_001813 [Breznakia sp. PF5-3]|uniref:hypothetical protein n=1 Tax=unclassified Breznakia TaxID=2623764 RepID=UPI002406BC19|nr:MULTISPECIES: hypothetical protein [unclassified Breznakia]MDF9825358.1 hypothetical protein [Breznakia sp. PM6-1]MDF9836236.1 hypothetical protein [Breznakia sp. PF5-3]MDF9838524.1 hypothetical protein [Breznakia sp. PFB2-8]MDF9860481.1 hypothetical protein [Breznakia sp. PH5-24]